MLPSHLVVVPLTLHCHSKLATRQKFKKKTQNYLIDLDDRTIVSVKLQKSSQIERSTTNSTKVLMTLTLAIFETKMTTTLNCCRPSQHPSL